MDALKLQDQDLKVYSGVWSARNMILNKYHSERRTIMSTQQTPGAGYTMPTPDQLPKLRLVTPLFPGMIKQQEQAQEDAAPEKEMPLPQTPYTYAQGMPNQTAAPLYAGAPNAPKAEEEEEEEEE
jgi:hypothetical protein